MYTKKDQLKKKEVTRKTCSECKRNRELRFFGSKRAVKCIDCKRKGWAKKLRESPGKVNKRRDVEWSKSIKERDGNKCVYCGKTSTLNSHHLFSRSNHALRWDLSNGITLCAAHHTLSSTFSAHKTPLEFAEWIKERNGEEWYENLRRKARETTT